MCRVSYAAFLCCAQTCTFDIASKNMTATVNNSFCCFAFVRKPQLMLRWC